MSVEILGRDNLSVIARDTDIDMAYRLTNCCGATGKGSEVESGVVCRACYRQVDSEFGYESFDLNELRPA